MNWVRKSFVGLLSSVLLVALLGGAGALSLNQNFSTPDNLKEWLAQSNIYEHVVDGQLDQAEEEDAAGGVSDSVSLDNAEVRQAAKEALTPALVEETVNAFLDGNYAWLRGETPKPEFSADLKGAKQTFAQKVGQIVETRLNNLPACTPEQLAQLQIPFDPLVIECRPASLVPSAEGARVTQEINNSEFLNDGVITPENLAGNETGNEKPYYEQLSKAPQAYQIGQQLPIIAAGVALLAGTGIVFVSSERRRGWRRVGVTFAVAGVVLLATKLASGIVSSRLDDAINGSEANTELGRASGDLAQTIASSLTQSNMVLGLVFLAVAGGIFFWLYKSREQATHPVKRSEPSNDSTPLEEEDDILDEEDLHPQQTKPEAPRALNRPPIDISGPPVLRSSRPPLRSADEVPKIKRPPQKKPPRLIQ